jgi:2'-5' RNA ligase
MRAFVSVDPEGLEGEIEALQGEFEDVDGLDFVAPESVHLTLFFSARSIARAIVSKQSPTLSRKA